jgi:hypothetical protein
MEEFPLEKLEQEAVDEGWVVGDVLYLHYDGIIALKGCVGSSKLDEFDGRTFREPMTCRGIFPHPKIIKVANLVQACCISLCFSAASTIQAIAHLSFLYPNTDLAPIVKSMFTQLGLVSGLTELYSRKVEQRILKLEFNIQSRNPTIRRTRATGITSLSPPIVRRGKSSSDHPPSRLPKIGTPNPPDTSIISKVNPPRSGFDVAYVSLFSNDSNRL